MAGTTKIVYWQEDEMWLGYLQDYPDYWTQGASLEALQENLLDIHDDITAGHIETAALLPEDDPILKFIGGVSHGELAQNIDDELYG